MLFRAAVFLVFLQSARSFGLFGGGSGSTGALLVAVALTTAFAYALTDLVFAGGSWFRRTISGVDE